MTENRQFCDTNCVQCTGMSETFDEYAINCFFSLNHSTCISENSSFVLYFPLNLWLLTTPFPLEFPLALLGLWRLGGLMVSGHAPGSSGPGLGPDQGRCVMFLGKTLYSHSAF